MSTVELTPLERTQSLLDVSATERNEFRSCRRRWQLGVVENLEPKRPTWAFKFGTGIHSALEVLYGGGKIEDAIKAFLAWEAEVAQELAGLPNPERDEELAELWELKTLGVTMLENYPKYDKTTKIKLGKPLAVEGNLLTKKLKEGPPKGYPPEAAVMRHSSGRLWVPIVDPETKEPLESGACLSARIDLLAERKTPKLGVWVDDHKTAGQAPSDKALEFDDQATAYCYTVYRWLQGLIARGVVFNYLIKNAPKEPRILAKGDLSTAKDQLTTPDQYRAALKEHGLLIPGSGEIVGDKYAECMQGLLARGWDPFYRRFETLRSPTQLENFEQRLWDEYRDMQNAYSDGSLLYPNPSTFRCGGCPVAPICLAMEDGSDWEGIKESQFQQGEDRKA